MLWPFYSIFINFCLSLFIFDAFFKDFFYDVVRSVSLNASRLSTTPYMFYLPEGAILSSDTLALVTQLFPVFEKDPSLLGFVPWNSLGIILTMQNVYNEITTTDCNEITVTGNNEILY